MKIIKRPRISLLVLCIGGLTPLAERILVADDLVSYIVSYQSSAQIDRNLLQSHGHQITGDMADAGLMVVKSSNRADLESLPGVDAVAVDQMRFSVPQNEVVTSLATTPSVPTPGCASTTASCDLQWDLARIHLPDAWKVTQGSPSVKVAVLDTGVRSTHEEVGSNYDMAESRSFVQPNDGCPGDAGTAGSIEDFQGHGTWTALHIAGKNGPQMTGIAPNTTLVNVKVAGACGSGSDSWILQGMFYANQVGAQIINMSLGGYLCADGIVAGSSHCSNASSVGDGPALWKMYTKMVQYLQARDTLVVAAAGNDHVRFSATGRIISDGRLTFTTSLQQDLPANDLRGLSLIPPGLDGVLAVGAVNRVTAIGIASETAYGQFGAGEHDQLTYYSNYGERVDVSAPGGASNFNLPGFDCRDSECSRTYATVFSPADNPGDFGATATCDTCYVNLQGTSMAAPQVAGVAALALAVNPHMHTNLLRLRLTSWVTPFMDPNAAPAIATSGPHSNFDVDYGNTAIPNSLMGSGVIDAAKAVQ
jgi:subtilisin family serine protease